MARTAIDSLVENVMNSEETVVVSAVDYDGIQEKIKEAYENDENSVEEINLVNCYKAKAVRIRNNLYIASVMEGNNSAGIIQVFNALRRYEKTHQDTMKEYIIDAANFNFTTETLADGYDSEFDIVSSSKIKINNNRDYSSYAGLFSELTGRIINIDKMNVTGVKSMVNWFYKYKNKETVITNVNWSEVDNLDFAFCDCALKKLSLNSFNNGALYSADCMLLRADIDVIDCRSFNPSSLAIFSSSFQIRNCKVIYIRKRLKNFFTTYRQKIGIKQEILNKIRVILTEKEQKELEERKAKEANVASVASSENKLAV